jgi:single-stranded-DNA-specific exonuclease
MTLASLAPAHAYGALPTPKDPPQDSSQDSPRDWPQDAGAEVRQRWLRAALDEARIRALEPSLGRDRRLARLLVARGVTDAETAERYLNPRLADIPDPFLLKDLGRAAERICAAIARKESVALYGDYDVDGVTSTALLATFLRREGLEPRIYIPKRLTEGYGLNQTAVDTLAAEKVKLLITLDCGITASEEIARANGHGIDCIVVDHHRCPPSLPPAYATLNPHQSDCGYPDKVLAAVGVCFNLLVGTRKLLRERGAYTEAHAEPNLKRLLDLVALGTIADMVPLSGVNRVLARFGLEELRLARRPGIRALLEISKTEPSRAASSAVAFKLGPRINAAGRLADASVGVRLLLTEQIDEARRLASSLDLANSSRQAIETSVFEAAIAQVDAAPAVPDAVVLYDERWHPGVVGIVAAKLVERYGRPTILIGEGGRGSARTARGLHLYQAISDVEQHLRKFGGHRAAAGLTVDPEAFPQFREAFLDRVRHDSELDRGAATLVYDDELPPGEVNLSCADALARLEPFGNGNPEPLFYTGPVSVQSSKIVGKGHLKLRLAEGPRGGIEAIAFRRAELLPVLYPGRALELAFHLERNVFAGVESLGMRVKDLRPLD